MLRRLANSVIHRLTGLIDIGPVPTTAPAPQPWAFLRSIVGQIRLPLGIIVCGNALHGIIDGLTPYLWKHVVDLLSSSQTGHLLWENLLIPLLTYVGIGLFGSFVINRSSSLFENLTLGTGLAALVQRQLTHYQLGQSISFFQNDFSGRIASQLRETARNVSDILFTFYHDLLTYPVSIILSLLLLSTANYLFLIPFTIWGIAFTLTHQRLLPVVNRLSSVNAAARSAEYGRLVDTLSNMNLVKLFAHSGREDARIVTSLQTIRRLRVQQQLANTGLNTLTYALNTLLQLSTLLLAVWLRIQDQITTGDVIMAITAVTSASDGIAYLAGRIAALVENMGEFKENLTNLTRPYQVTDAHGAKPLQVIGGAVSFHNVGFSYHQSTPETPKPPQVFHNLSIAIPAGQRVGLVGASGAGKSTFVSLLLRFHDVQHGTISIDGQNIAGVTQESLRSHISVVAQDTALFHQSVADNIRYGRPEATDAEVEHAARLAHAHAFIQALTDKDGRSGYAARVGERGVKLSGGQRQRIAIARLILKDAPILVLDEATSALDSESEQVIQQNLTTLMEGKTVIAIAHRLSTIAMLDRIIVLAHGEIVEDGTHRELLALNGHYARLWQRQSGGFLPE